MLAKMTTMRICLKHFNLQNVNATAGLLEKKTTKKITLNLVVILIDVNTDSRNLTHLDLI